MKWLGIVAALVAVAIVTYGVAYPSVTVRYRLTIEALVDGELKTGSSVREVTYSKQSEFAAQHELSIGYRGEAVVFDLGSRGTLFALLAIVVVDGSRNHGFDAVVARDEGWIDRAHRGLPLGGGLRSSAMRWRMPFQGSGCLRPDRPDSREVLAYLPLRNLDVVVGLKIQPKFG